MSGARSEREVVLGEAELPLQLALKRMLDVSIGPLGPFVIVEHVETDRFVQFATECPASSGLPILFDVPALGISEGRDSVRDAVSDALEVLRKDYGLGEEAGLRIIEDVTFNKPRGGILSRVRGLFPARAT